MGFWEILVIAFVGLLVIGPDKLPETIKTVLIWVGRLKRLIGNTRSELEDQLGMDEIRREIHNQEVLDSLKVFKDIEIEAEQEASNVRQSIEAETAPNINDDFEPEDEGLYGEQRANHPSEEDDNASTNTSDSIVNTDTDNTADKSKSP